MNSKDAIQLMINQLLRKNICCTKEFTKDIQKLVTTNLTSFIRNFYKDFIHKNFDDYNKFEVLKNLSPIQKKRLRGNLLRRYEYRDTSNLRCIFVVCKDKENDTIIVLCAFNEDGNKKRGKNSYNGNINRAITIFENYVED